MEKVSTSVWIDAPVEKVFAFWADPTNRVELWPSLVEIKDVELLPEGGTRHKWVYKMAGVRLEGHAEVIEYVPNERIVEREFNGIQATMTWTYQPEDGGTRVNTDVEYEVPLPVLGKLAERVIIKQNHKEAQQVADNLKARMEA